MRIERGAVGAGGVALGATLATLWATAAGAVNVNFVSGSVGNDLAVMEELLSLRRRARRVSETTVRTARRKARP